MVAVARRVRSLYRPTEDGNILPGKTIELSEDHGVATGEEQFVAVGRNVSCDLAGRPERWMTAETITTVRVK